MPNITQKPYRFGESEPPSCEHTSDSEETEVNKYYHRCLAVWVASQWQWFVARQKARQQMKRSLTKRKLLPDVLVDKLEVVHCIASCLAIVPVPSHSDVRRRIALRLVGAIP